VYGWRRYAAHRALKRAAIAAAAPQPADAQRHVNGDAAAPSAFRAVPGAPASAGSAASASAPGAPLRLDLSVSTSDVTRVRVVADGRVVLDARLPAGETRHLSARNQFVVSAEHPSAVLLDLNGQAMPQLGSGGASGTIVLSQKNLRQASGGNSQP
jgi:Domain of unknown function (DUF4115)